MDQVIYSFIQNIRTPWLTEFMIVVSQAFEPTYVIIISLALIIVLLYHRHVRFALIYALSLLFGWLAESSLKLIFGFARPLNPILPTSTFSFPSGHATVVTIFAVLLVYFLHERMHNFFQRFILIIAAIILILLVGFSRLYLNAHWFSDVIAGYLLGAAISLFFIWLLREKLVASKH